MQADRGFVIADVPGLIEGAAEGAGLGLQFLRHLVRTRLLLHIVDIAPSDAAIDPVKQVRAIGAELKKFDPALFRKPRWIVLNKIDLIDPERRQEVVEQVRRRLRTKAPVFAISGVTGEGCRDLMWAVQRFLFEQTGAEALTDPSDPRFAAVGADE
jgi:GTP-binding protein